MNRAEKLEAQFCMAEIEAVRDVASRPMTRKQWLLGRKWWKFQVGRLMVLGYKGKVKRYMRHVAKLEVKDGVVPSVVGSRACG
jgi:hypothetical protein